MQEMSVLGKNTTLFFKRKKKSNLQVAFCLQAEQKIKMINRPCSNTQLYHLCNNCFGA